MEVHHCRFCAEAKSVYDLLNWCQDSEVYQQYLKIIAALKLDYINMNDITLPTTTCEACYDSFTASFSFLEKVQKSQIKLKAIYQQPMKSECVQARIKTENISNAMSYENVTIPNIQNVPLPLPQTEVKSETVSMVNTMIHMEIEPLCDLSLDTTKHIKQEIVASDDSDTSIDQLEDNTKAHASTVKDKKLSTADYSWNNYKWTCLHCKIKFESMTDLRDHSKGVHDKCFAFTCSDCEDQFNTFNCFIEHVRRHRDVLRYYCQYCNKKFYGPKACEKHVLTHWSGSQKICFYCGEVFPDAEALDSHKKLYKVWILPTRYKRKIPKVIVPEDCYDGVSNWENYQWTCQECCVRMPDVQALRAHAQSFHNKCFNMKCVDCLTVIKNYTLFVRHVRRHRPYLEKYCQYCNGYFENVVELHNHVAEHLCSDQKPCDGCGQIFENNSLLSEHLRKYDPPRRYEDLATEDLTCEMCGKVFQYLSQLRTHRLTHDKNRKRDYICYICGKSYFDSRMLSQHIKSHDDSNKNEVCQICNKVFLTVNKLRAHIKSHEVIRLFNCSECGKQFKTKSQLVSHVERHMKEKKFHCIVCSKSFQSKSNLKTHMNTHSSTSPYSCTHCEKTFNSWGNCNKHMLRKHGVSFAKTKVTAQGRLDIDKETGKVVKLATGEEVKEWISEVMTLKKQRKKKRDEGS